MLPIQPNNTITTRLGRCSSGIGAGFAVRSIHLALHHIHVPESACKGLAKTKRKAPNIGIDLNIVKSSNWLRGSHWRKKDEDKRDMSEKAKNLCRETTPN